jgi:hypothetical protein
VVWVPSEDFVVNVRNGYAIHRKLQKPWKPYWVDGAGHNDIEMTVNYPMIKAHHLFRP